MKFVFSILITVAFGCSVLANNNHNHGHFNSKSASALPAWRLTDANRNIVSSDQFAGRPYVLVLHLGKGCLHCARQLQAFEDHIDSFRGSGFEVVAVSTDDANDLAEQLEGYGETFSIPHLLSDHQLSLFRGVGAWNEPRGEALHATLLVDAAGRIRWSGIGDHPFMDLNRLLGEAHLVSTGSTTVQEDENPKRPKIFLNKSARIVDWQLKRLSNERLLMITRKTDDKKYAPVWTEILSRKGMDAIYRKQALAALIELNESSAASELIAALKKMDSKGSRPLANMLLRVDTKDLEAVTGELVKTTASNNQILARASFAALVSAGLNDKAIEMAELDSARTIRFLQSVAMIKNREARNSLRKQVLSKVDDSSDEVRKAAVLALKHFNVERKDTFVLLASKIGDGILRDAVIETLLTVPTEDRDAELAEKVVQRLLKRAEATHAENRTRPNALRAMELADVLISDMDEEKADAYLARMREVSVRVVRIRTVEEEMRYDVPYFAAQAGRPIQIVLENEDLMPHNLIVCKPGKLKQVAIDGLAAGPTGGKDGKQYVPKSRDVLFATDMVQAHQSERLTFTAPTKAGEYPFVCTFPQHWSRMYGVMVVVDDLATWEKNPVKPEDPIGNKRQLVKKWTMDDFVAEMQQDLGDRSLDNGKQIFTEATCAQCHRVGDFGGAGANVGPALDELYRRWKRDRGEAFRQILDPSSHVDPKYQMYIIATDDGLTRTGLIVSQNDEKIELLESGSIDKTTTILKDEIEEMAKSKKSVMPKALLDNYTKDEILDLVNWLESQQK